ncbi:MAG: XkdX family protein [Lachnospira eligens]
MRLFLRDYTSKGEVTKEQVKERVTSGKITKEDYKHITGEDYASSIEIIDTQNTIIKMQSEIIYDLFGLLKQYVSVEESETTFLL